jgi:DNA-directed RNA polymerase specialized sigma subunit
LLTDEIETGKRGILDLIQEYDPESGVPLAAYINKFLPSRAIEASKRVLGEEFTEDVAEKVDVAAEEVVTEVKAKPKKKKIVLADRLGVTKEVAKAIKKIVPDLEIDKLNFKTLKNKIPEIIGELFGISPKKLISGANITKKELQSAQMFINKHADLLIAMLPKGATASGII